MSVLVFSVLGGSVLTLIRNLVCGCSGCNEKSGVNQSLSKQTLLVNCQNILVWSALYTSIFWITRCVVRVAVDEKVVEVCWTDVGGGGGGGCKEKLNEGRKQTTRSDAGCKV
jgi:hypothetical protein